MELAGRAKANRPDLLIMTREQDFGKWGEDKAAHSWNAWGISCSNATGAANRRDRYPGPTRWEIVVVEVKTRSKLISGDQYMSDAQAHRLLNAAEVWMKQNQVEAELRCGPDPDNRNSENYQIRHVEDAWHDVR